VEQHGRILAASQLATAPTTVKRDVSPSSVMMKSTESRKMSVSPKREQQEKHADCVAHSNGLPRPMKTKHEREARMADALHVPKFSTEAVFSVKTEEMDKDYFFPQGVRKRKSGCYLTFPSMENFLCALAFLIVDMHACSLYVNRWSLSFHSPVHLSNTAFTTYNALFNCMMYFSNEHCALIFKDICLKCVSKHKCISILLSLSKKLLIYYGKKFTKLTVNENNHKESF